MAQNSLKGHFCMDVNPVIKRRVVSLAMVVPIFALVTAVSLAFPKLIFGTLNFAAWAVMIGLMAFMTYTIINTDGRELPKQRPTHLDVKPADPRTRVISAAIVGVAFIAVAFIGMKSPDLLFTPEVLGFLVMLLIFLGLGLFIWHSVVPPVPKEIRERAISLSKRANNPKLYAKHLIARTTAQTEAVVAAEQAAALAQAQAHAEARAQAEAVAAQQASEEVIEIEDGESLEEIKARLKPKKPKISMELLNTANSYDDKVALLRFLVSEDSARVSKAIQNFIR
ncbi:MAG: Flagellar M-ring protein [Pseudomonadota bacterium]